MKKSSQDEILKAFVKKQNAINNLLDKLSNYADPRLPCRRLNPDDLDWDYVGSLALVQEKLEEICEYFGINEYKGLKK